ncbi:MAG: Gfo/Idh/MocA family oxidoreductase [Candidatus Bathyarchaeota archaeon]
MKVGIIGCGHIANAHLKVYKNLKNVNIVGVCDLNLDLAKETAHRFGVENVYKDYSDFFEVKDLDMVDICTPIATHGRIACDAAKEVPAILVEKPMALSVSECDDIINAVKKHGSKLCVVHQQLFLPSVERAKLLVDNGAYDLLSFKTTQKESFEVLKANKLAADWMVAPKQNGILWEVCSHLAYLQLHFLSDITEVYAIGNKTKYPVHDHFFVLLKTKDHRFGMIELSWITKETEIFYEMCDSTGKRAQVYRNFDYFLENQAEYAPYSVGGVLRGFFTDEKRVLQKWGRFGLNYFKGSKLISHFKLISNYLESIEKDLPPPVTPEDGRKTIQLLECIRKSLDEQRPVSVPS